MTEEITHTTPREGYNLWAPRYDTYDNALIALEEPLVTELVGPVDGLRIADIGCGTGRYSLRMASAGGRVVGVDFSLGMLDVLRDKREPGSIQLIEHDLNDGIPLDANTFDLVICSLVIEHLPDIDGIVRELARICTEAGCVIISDFHPEMIRRGFHARFRESPSGDKVQIGGAHHPVSDYVMAAVRAGLHIDHISEHVMDEETAKRSQSAAKWVGLPLLLVLKLSK